MVKSPNPFQDATSLKQDAILDRLNEARDLSEQEHGEAALLLAWSATEALLRYIADAESIEVTAHNPAQVAKSLYVYGVLDKEQYQALQDALHTRNMVVHGFTERNSLVDAVTRLLAVAGQLQHLYP